MDLTFRPEALTELEEITAWYAHRSPAAAAVFEQVFLKALSDIRDHPHRWPKIWREFRRYLTKRYPYGIYYRVDETVITIFAIAHAKRRPGYWRERLKH